MDHYTRHLQHLVSMAKNPGSKAHAWQRAKELEADQSGLWPGITQALTLAVAGQAEIGESAPRNVTKRR